MRPSAAGRARSAAAPRVPHCLGLIHSLWPDGRLLRSPLLLLPLAAGVAVWGARGHPLPWQRFFLAQLPLLAAFLALGIAQARVLRQGVLQDWFLTGRPMQEIHRAVFLPVWIGWWLAMVAQSTVHQWLRWPEIRSALAAGTQSAVLMAPGTQGFAITGDPGAERWDFVVWLLLTGVTPVLLAFWAWAARWFTEWCLRSCRPVAVPLLSALGVLVAVRWGFMRGASEIQFRTALALQGVWPERWPLAGRLLAGAYVGWLALPAALSALALLFRRLTRRPRGLASMCDQA